MDGKFQRPLWLEYAIWALTLPYTAAILRSYEKVRLIAQEQAQVDEYSSENRFSNVWIAYLVVVVSGYDVPGNPGESIGRVDAVPGVRKTVTAFITLDACEDFLRYVSYVSPLRAMFNAQADHTVSVEVVTQGKNSLSIDFIANDTHAFCGRNLSYLITK